MPVLALPFNTGLFFICCFTWRLCHLIVSLHALPCNPMSSSSLRALLPNFSFSGLGIGQKCMLALSSIMFEARFEERACELANQAGAL
ncbi:hypothetical protein BDZ97DRAFT_1783781 [Flammula alnicola]|nr:hypothetical protein BDZ97DRAFT_1783781 [Flammula alnicola]